jgi:hypothetical protein
MSDFIVTPPWLARGLCRLGFHAWLYQHAAMRTCRRCALAQVLMGFEPGNPGVWTKVGGTRR